MSQDKTSHEPLHYPTNKIFAIINRPQDAEAAIEALTSAGIERAAIEVYSGLEQAHRADAPDGFFAKIRHAITTGGEESVYIERHKEALLAGHTLIGVPVQDDAAKHAIRDVLAANHGHFINYYGQWTIEELLP